LNTAAHSGRKAALTFIFVTVLIDMLAFGMIIPVLPVLVQDFMGGKPHTPRKCTVCFGTPGRSCNSSSRPCRLLSDHFGAAHGHPHLLRRAGSGFHPSWHWRQTSGGCWSAG